jgi:flagellar hook assembly protein FlgD
VALVPASTGSVAVSAAGADGAATVTVNGAASGNTVAVEPGMSQTVTIVVSSPATTDRTRTYTVDLKRGTALSGFSAKPKVGKTYTLSPGGTNRLTFSYTMAGPGTVKIEIQKGTKWIALTTRTETSAGAKTWAWNGKVSGKYLAVGTYKARITPSAFGMKSPASTISFKIAKYPTVAWKSVATKYKATGAVRTLCVFKVNNPTDAVVRVYNAKGKVVAVAKSFTNLLPSASATVTWNGRATDGNTAKLKVGALVPTGSYTIRIAAGSKTYTKSIKITR